MTLRERIADWISGGMFANERTAAHILCLQNADLRAEAANIAAQRDEAIARAEVALAKLDAVAPYSAALRAILTARNITEARKIARDALGEAE